MSLEDSTPLSGWDIISKACFKTIVTCDIK